MTPIFPAKAMKEGAAGKMNAARKIKPTTKGRVNFPVAKQQLAVSPKTTHKFPIKGKARNSSIYHETRGRMGTKMKKG